MSHANVPVEFIFHPSWWYHNYGISFDETFYLDKDTRIQNDIKMRQALYQRFGLGDGDSMPRPVIGSMHVAGGFVMPAIFGVEIRFSPHQAPWPVSEELSTSQVWDIDLPQIENTWPMRQIMADMAILKREFGYVVGDFDTDGILNTATALRGQRLFTDFHEAPALVRHLFQVITDAYVQVASYLKSHTGTCAVATNRSILNVDSTIYLHSNCSVSMISPSCYGEFLSPYELQLAERLKPYGIHHCGSNLEIYAKAYRKIHAVFFDVGWGSDVRACRDAFPDAFLNLRLSPVRMLQQTPEDIYADAKGLLAAAGSTENVGLCCINMGFGTPDENVKAAISATKG